LPSCPEEGWRKRRARISLASVVVAVDEFRGDLSGLVLAEIEGVEQSFLPGTGKSTAR